MAKLQVIKKKNLSSTKLKHHRLKQIYQTDIEALKQLKNGVEPSSMTPGSSLRSWDFTVDPCDSLFSERFTCGFRCNLTVSGLSRVTE
ncbi:hypothetical protein CCACVL1_04591, partial [Corchorus capsularis]